jgi:hypothetical protein
MGKAISAALAKRHRQSVIVSEMMISIVAGVRWAFKRKKNFSGLFEEWLVAMAIRLNDGRGGKPLTVASIAKNLGIPRSNAKRAVEGLIGEGMIRKEGAGFVGSIEFLQKQIDADYFKIAVGAIIAAADRLRALEVSR